VAKRLGEILVEFGVVTPGEVDEALEMQKGQEGKKKKIGDILVKEKCCTHEDVAKAVAHQCGKKYCNLGKLEVSEAVIDLINKETAVEHGIVPLKKGRRNLMVASSIPMDFMVLEDLRFIVGFDLDYVIASRDAINDAIGKYYGEMNLDEQFTQMTMDIQFGGGDMSELEADGDEDEAPIIKLVNQIIANGVGKRASDIHVEPMERVVRVRYRVDGECIEQEPLPKKLQGAIISRLKIMARMRPEEKRIPQDGNIKMQLAGRDIDFRVNALPASHGESVVLRILDKEKALVDLEELGLHRTDFQKFESIIKRPNGVFLVTGPTGSGKTTTLYGALKKLNTPDIKIITAENPVEYSLEGINQAQVNHDIGFNFSRILKAMLRQAPNIILVGEIRDEETANIAIEAALTGHLVFSTLHTNSAPGSISRLVDMNVKPFLVASAVLAILAQRLVRKLCKHCRSQADPDPEMVRAVGLRMEQLRGRKTYNPEGCNKCDNKGYRGRCGVYELMEMTPALRELTFKGVPTDELAKAAVSGGMSTLQMDGVRKVVQGMTTFDEVLSITHRQDTTYA
jgi:type IV pilus assembly protein PilB